MLTANTKDKDMEESVKKLNIKLNPRKLNEKVNSDEFKKKLDDLYNNLENDNDDDESDDDSNEDKIYFPFLGGNTNLFTFLIKPYLSDLHLGKMAGLSRGIRKYVVKDLRQYWFNKYIEKYGKHKVKKIVRSQDCDLLCFGRDTVNHYCKAHHLPNQIGNTYYPCGTCARKKVSNGTIYKENKRCYKKELPPNCYSGFWNTNFNCYNYYGPTYFVYNNEKVCMKHYKKQYFDTKAEENQRIKRSNVDYFSKIVFYDVWQYQAQVLSNRISASGRAISKTQGILDYYQRIVDQEKRKLKMLNKKLELRKCIKQQIPLN
tara:strand:+ start:2825 stop:3775 length:951 start_codon:yes stop_codon:yes gene_type:complete